MTEQTPAPLVPAEVERKKRPASQYYWGDWWKDKGLHSCSLTARGLWHEMNCLMHEGEPYGHLTLNGRPMTTAQLANQCRISAAQCAKLLRELEDAGVPSRTPEGVIFSRRMVRDEAARNARAEGGKLGAEHGSKGAEHGSKGGRPAVSKGGSKTPLDGLEKPPPSSSSSSSTSLESANALSARGAVGIALKAGGIDPMSINLADPRIDALIAAGATPDHWEGLAREAVKTQKAKPIAWVLAVLPERLKTAANTPKASRHAGFASKDYRQGVDADGTFTA